MSPQHLSNARLPLQRPAHAPQHAPLHRLGRSLVLTIAAALMVGTAAVAATPAQFQSAHQQFELARQGDSDAIAGAAATFQGLSDATPSDPVLRAYAGSAGAMRARTTWLPWKKMGYAEDGLAQLDKALAQLRPADDAPRYRGTPASLEVRFTAASTFLALPSMFNRHARGQKLLAEVLASPLFDGCPLGFRGAVWLMASQEAADNQQPAEARAYLQRIVQAQAPQAALAQARLQELAK